MFTSAVFFVRFFPADRTSNAVPFVHLAFLVLEPVIGL